MKPDTDMPAEPVYGLVCAGGGAHGAYQVGVLKYVHENFCVGEASPFRVFGGTSAGSLSTAFLASRSYDALDAHLELEYAWHDFHVRKYHGNIVKNAVVELVEHLAPSRKHSKPMWSLLSAEPLHDVISKCFLRECLDRAIAEGTTLGLAVSATEIRSSRSVWFQEGPAAVDWLAVNSQGIRTALGVPHVQASCSVPFAFPPVLIDGHYYADGGVGNKTPFAPAINMGATRILSIATDQPLPLQMPDYPPEFKPSLRDVFGMLMTQLSHDHADNQAALINAINLLRDEVDHESEGSGSEAPHVLLGDEIRPLNYRPVETLLIAPSKRIRHSEAFNPDLFDESLKSESTVMLFHRDFVEDLINFGYEDARSRHEELRVFFDRERPQSPTRFMNRHAPVVRR